VARFEEIAQRFWDTSKRHGVLPALTDDLVAATEHKLNVTLPEELVFLLRVQNGGWVSRSCNRFPSARNYYADDFVPFTFMHGIGPRAESGPQFSLLDTPYLIDEWDLPHQIVLLYGEGHYWIALDYRWHGLTAEPSVTWIDNEMDHELPLAPTFRSFVEGLAPNPDWTESTPAT
jgi:hypothetical protein